MPISIEEPGRIGPVTLRNRIIMPAMDSGLGGNGGRVTDRLVNYYHARGAGGVGAIIVELCAVSPLGVTHQTALRIDADDYVTEHRRLARAIKSTGAAAFLQLSHCGRQSSPRFNGGFTPVAPSPIPSPVIKVIPHELTTQEIEQIAEQWVSAAQRAEAAGYDGIEIHAAHGYLLHEFLSPLTNHRTDQYGGNPCNRMRLLLKIVRMMKQTVHHNFPIIVRFSALEFIEGGITLDQSVTLASKLAAAGADALDVSGGTYETFHRIIPPYLVDRGSLLTLAKTIKEKVPQIPVIAVGSIDANLAESALRQDAIDFVAIGRGLIADPELPKKLFANQEDRIRPCVLCNECIASAFKTRPIVCTVNPNVGYEASTSSIPYIDRTDSKPIVIIVGSGPGGLHLALFLHDANFTVKIFEREEFLAPKLLLIGAETGKHEYISYRQWLMTQIASRNIEVFLGKDFTVQTARQLPYAPAAIIAATGAMPILPPTSASTTHQNSSMLRSADDAIKEIADGTWSFDEAAYAKHVVIVGGSGTGCELAEMLVDKKVAITIVTKGDKVAKSLEPMSRSLILQKLHAHNVSIQPHKLPKDWDNSSIILEDRLSNNLVQIPYHQLYWAIGYESDNRLYQELGETLPHIRRFIVGDAAHVGKIYEANRDAYQVAHAIIDECG